ncbi:MAG: hypothetical protein CXR31_14050 [Geobacter sp.]|nr:MAG: hypothetical protein CXR31_14050 [Geobacter sp.]
MIKISKFVLVVLLLLLPMIALADSLNIKNGRYSGGPVIVIKLTEKQKERIDKKYKPYNKMKLTKSQQTEIASKAKMKEPPTQVIVVRPEDTQVDCTCGIANIGLILKGGVIELPVSYLATDKEAKEMEIVD